MKNDICVYMKKRIDIRIDEEKLLIIRAYCERHKKNITAFFDKGADLVIEKYNVKGEYRPKPRHWNKMYSTRKFI